MTTCKKRMVILGAGYVGIFLATSIVRYVTEKIGEVILIDRNPYHQLLQEIHLVAADFRTVNEVQIPILKLIDRTSIKFIQSAVKQIMPDNMVGLESIKINYDLLIVCLGASIKYFNIKGARENTLSLHSISDASLICDKMRALLKSNKKHDIIIVGGGATGVSLGGALSDFVKGSKKSDMLTITIIEALPTILSGWDERLVEKVNEVLLKKEIRIRTISAVIRVENDSGTSCSNIYLSDSESQIPSSLTVWTAGVKGYEIPISPEVEKTKDDRIILNEFCQVGSYPNIFCIGDIAAVKDENGKLYPPLVQIAVREAKYLSKIIPKHLSKIIPKHVIITDHANLRSLPPNEKI